jgi:hypothetical protein
MTIHNMCCWFLIKIGYAEEKKPIETDAGPRDKDIE